MYMDRCTRIERLRICQLGQFAVPIQIYNAQATHMFAEMIGITQWLAVGASNVLVPELTLPS